MNEGFKLNFQIKIKVMNLILFHEDVHNYMVKLFKWSWV